MDVSQRGSNRRVQPCVGLDDILRARRGIAPLIHVTPLEHSSTLSELCGTSIYLKLESFQKTGSFKLRGAAYKILSLTPAQREHGVIAASAGNHAQGVAYAATQLGIPAHIVMPRWAPVSKVAATRAYGAEVVLKGDSFSEAYRWACEMAEAGGFTFIHAFDDPYIIAGQGTIGLEILEQLDTVGTVIVPVGGGGLIAGIGAAVKMQHPGVKVVGVQAEAASAFCQSWHQDRIVTLPAAPTIADGLSVQSPGTLTLDAAEAYVDDVVTVSDEEIARAILLLLERHKWVVEGAGAVGVAAALSGRLALGKDPVAVVVSGGNIDVDVISQVIERGLIETGRRLRVRVMLLDRPGALHQLTGTVADQEGNILGIHHERSNPDVPFGRTLVMLTLAVRDRDHGGRIVQALEGSGYQVEVLA